MKLSQNYENRQTRQKREYEQFRRQILRHGAAFGVVYGTATGLGQDSPFEPGSGRSSVSPGTITAIVGRVETAAAGLQSSFNNIISGISARRERRRIIGQWLKLSDHILEDIGLERSEIETLRDRGGDPETYIREIRSNRQISKRNLRLIDCTGKDSKADVHQAQADARLDTGLHKAA
jgi:uncharacterized protein YjiS (DUF1127 family)